MPNRYWILILVTALFSSALGARQPAPEVVVFTHVTVVDPGGTPTERDRTVVVTGDRISEIGRTGEVRVPPGARVVDAGGKYLIPGLWDMHAHIFTHRGDAFFPLYAVAGVTAVRDMNTVVPMAEIQEHRERLAAGTLVGPRLIAVAGPLIAGPAGGGRFPPQSVVGTPAEGCAAVAEADGGHGRQRALPVTGAGDQPARGAEAVRRVGIPARRGAEGGDTRSGPGPRARQRLRHCRARQGGGPRAARRPLADIRNTKRIQAVMLNGRLLDRKALDAIQSRLEVSAPNQ